MHACRSTLEDPTIVEGAAPWAEDDWRELRIGDTAFAVTKACTRCAITTTDQRTGERFREPLRTLGRRRRTPDGVTFGIYLVPREVGGIIRVGDSVQLVGASET